MVVFNDKGEVEYATQLMIPVEKHAQHGQNTNQLIKSMDGKSANFYRHSGNGPNGARWPAYRAITAMDNRKSRKDNGYWADYHGPIFTCGCIETSYLNIQGNDIRHVPSSGPYPGKSYGYESKNYTDFMDKNPMLTAISPKLQFFSESSDS